MLFETKLPIQDVIPDLLRVLENGRNAVLEAPPGAGKTTIVPISLLKEPWLEGRRIVMLEPRRLAARAAAMRMADLLGEDVGKTVGYRTRLDSKVGPSTRIEVVTEGILTRFLQNDPGLTGIGIVIFDEFHERSIHADLGLALCLESQAVFRDDLRILVMSATLNGEDAARILRDAPIIKSEGMSHPVETRYLPQGRHPVRMDDTTGPKFISTVADAVIRALREEDGSILVFLPGGSEIRGVAARLREAKLPANLDVVPLYGDLPKGLQDLALTPSPPGRRKIVIATSIAETSLTIQGVRIVIDSGLMRVSRFSPSTGMSRLETIRVSMASAGQRRGRAGRLGPGVCIRLWTEGEDKTIREQNTPEIMEADLTPLALELAVWGAREDELKWLNPPPVAAMSHARDLLAHLGAVDKKGNITTHGKEISNLPLHPRLAHMVIKGREMYLGGLACELAALLTERDILRPQRGEADSDLRSRVDALSGSHSGAAIEWAALEGVKKVAGRLKRLLDIKGKGADNDKAGLLLALAYPDRIGKRRPGGERRYLLANGRGGYFSKPEPLSSEEYIVAANLDGRERESRIFLAAPISEAELNEHFAHDIMEDESVNWDSSQKAVMARKQRKLWNLILNDSPLRKPDEGKVLKALISGIGEAGLIALPWDRIIENLRARINFLHRIGEDLPDLSDERLLNSLGKCLAPWIKGMTRLEHLKRLDLKTILMGMLTWEQQKAMEKLAPTHITVPSGSRIPIDYLSGERPVLAVRLQEMFGLEKTPTIADGKVPLLIHLLSPAGRPVQVTEDLKSFWANGYPMVKKDLKGRYPKHYWPDDPLQAEPTNRAKKEK